MDGAIYKKLGKVSGDKYLVLKTTRSHNQLQEQCVGPSPGLRLLSRLAADRAMLDI